MTGLRLWRSAVAYLALMLGLMLGPPLARADLKVLPDSTELESFRLANGLRVVLRHVPGCRHVDVTLAYDFGRNDEPPGKEGLSSLLAEMEFFGATAEAPERSREEMASLRPAGWDLSVAPRVTRFSEMGTDNLLPGLIHQAADRMRGVQVTSTALARATGAVRADLDSACRLDVALALHNGIRVWALGGNEATLARTAAGRGLQGLSPKDVQQQLAATFVPANAVLAVAGNLRKIPLKALIQSEFGSIPAGTPAKHPRAAALDTLTRAVPRAETTRPVGVIGIVAPSLQDTLHAAFFLEIALVGSHCSKLWGPPEAPLTTRFYYSLFDDPDLVRFYPPVGPAEIDPRLLQVSLINSLNDLSRLMVPPASYIALYRGLDWLLGGPIPPEIFERVLREPAALHALCRSTAVRELWGGEAFWAPYRQRFRDAVGIPYPEWYKRILSPTNMVSLLFVPK